MKFGSKKPVEAKVATVKFSIPGTITVKKFPDGSKSCDAFVTDENGEAAYMRVDQGILVAMARNLGIGATVEVPVVIRDTKTFRRRDGSESTRIYATPEWTEAKGSPVPSFMRSEPLVNEIAVNGAPESNEAAESEAGLDAAEAAQGGK